MKKFMATLLSVMCAACAPSVTKVNVPDMEKSDSLSVQDARPAIEKDRKMFSLLITSRQYGIIREGDERLTPSPIRLLQHQVFEKFAASGRLPTVVVRHLVVYSNMKSQLRSGATLGAIGGLVGGVVANAAASHVVMANTEAVDESTFEGWSGEDEYQRGLFTESENPTKAPVYIVYVDTDIDGVKRFTRTVSSIRRNSDENPLATAVQLAIADHLSQSTAGVSKMGVAPTATAVPGNPAAAPTIVGASTPASMPVHGTAAMPTTATAQSVANQLGCGVVEPSGDTTYIASCGDHRVIIDCGGDRCRPTRSVRIQ